MKDLPGEVEKALRTVGAEKQNRRWKCPYCQTEIFRGDLEGEEFRCWVCCSKMDSKLEGWGVYDLLLKERRGAERLVQREVPGVTARTVNNETWGVAGPLETMVVSKSEVEGAINEHHEHHQAPHNAILGVKCVEKRHNGKEKCRGVATLSTPTSRVVMQRGTHLEVNRICTWGPRWRRMNVTSSLTGKLREAARKIRSEAQEKIDERLRSDRERKQVERRAGIGRLRTYILEHEDGASLRGAGWKLVGRSEGGSWCKSRDGRQERPTTEGPKWIYDTAI